MAMSTPATARFAVRIEDTGETYRCADTRSLLEGMEALGRKGIPVGCRGGGCGVCKVQIISGEYEARKMSRSYVSAEEIAQGIVLACRVYPRSEIRLEVQGKMIKAFGGVTGPCPEKLPKP